MMSEAQAYGAATCTAGLELVYDCVSILQLT
jgi:hypothetical protein